MVNGIETVLFLNADRASGFSQHKSNAVKPDEGPDEGKRQILSILQQCSVPFISLDNTTVVLPSTEHLQSRKYNSPTID